MPGGNLLIRNAEVADHGIADVRIKNGTIDAVGLGLRADAPEVRADGNALIPGLIDHHVHLLAVAAQMNSARVGPDDVCNADEFGAALRNAPQDSAGWVRATGYHESVAGVLNRDVLDSIFPFRPVRIQHRSGALWIMNSVGLEKVTHGQQIPGCVERDGRGRMTGRIWRGDSWLREQLGGEPPPLERVGKVLSKMGITAITDASVATGNAETNILSNAVRSSALPQRLMLMSGGKIAPSTDGCYRVGPVKIILDDHALPDIGDIAATIRRARAWHRNIAVHCVTAGELAVAITAFQEAGSNRGDRIEHGSIIDDEAAGVIARLGLTVVTQPAFIFERGDSYLRDVEPRDRLNLYRLAGLKRVGIPIAGSSDAPYTAVDPWTAIAAAATRKTRRGAIIGDNEGLPLRDALALFLGRASDPGGAPRAIAVGTPADLCLLDAPLDAALHSLPRNPVVATMIAGRTVYSANAAVADIH